MLSLTRKQHESIVLDNGVRIEVIKLSGNRVTLGVKAPNHVRILRGELVPAPATLKQPCVDLERPATHDVITG